MVTMVTAVGNQAADAISQQLTRQFGTDSTPALSQIAEQALAGLSRMQAEFGGVTLGSAPDGGTTALIPTTDAAPAPTPVDDTAMMREMTDAIANSTQVQAQLAQFMITASISTTMGSNLNTFLKGQ